MDRELYNGAIEGDVGVLMTYRDQLEVQLTPINNSVLHVTAQFLNSSTYVREIFKLQSSLLCKVNSKGETPLHIAAREGHYDVVKALIECAKTMGDELESGVRAAKEMMLRMPSENGDTALHKAVYHDHLDVVKFLIEEDPEFSHLANKASETPLYLAAERGLDHIVSQLVETCTSMSYGGPDGRTALHAAVIHDSEGSTSRLLGWKESLTKETDIYGWTPLHHAAYFGRLSRVKQLLVADKSAAYVAAEKDYNNTALHLAAGYGRLDVVKELITYCPDCSEMVNSRGQNMIHIAFEHKSYDVIHYFLENPRFRGTFINQKDIDGNTPFHLIVSSYSNDQIAMDEKDKLKKVIMHPKVDKRAFNNDNLTPADLPHHNNAPYPVYWSMLGILERFGAPQGCRDVIKRKNYFDNERRKSRVEPEKLKPQGDTFKNIANTQLIVATLVATVTFAAGFTLPGGYDSNDGPNQGMAILIREAAFKAFVVSDTIAMILSTCAIFLLLIASFYADQKVKVFNRTTAAFYLVLFAIGAMVVAFMTGMYATLAHSLGLAIFVCIICSFSFYLYYFLLKRAFHDGLY